MANQWVVEIRRAKTGGVFFLPFVPGAQPDDPLLADAGDTMLWSNRTTLDLDLESTDPPGLSVDQTLTAGSTSASLFNFPGGTVKYECKQPLKAHVIQE
jgi:hypothetical protein